MNKPLVTIGIPVYNGENYLTEAIESVLNQTFGDFQLVICDNASTDATQEICLSYDDPRIKYHRNPENIGGAKNFNLVFQKSDSVYFSWLAHDDLIAPEYLEKSVAILETNPKLAMASSRSLVIDSKGDVIGNYDHEMRLNSDSPSERFRRLLWVDFFPELFSLKRSDLIAKTDILASYAGSDRMFIAHMILLGGVGYSEERLFVRRIHENCYSIAVRDNTEKNRWFSHPENNISLSSRFLGLVKLKAYRNIISSSDISLQEKARSYFYLIEWFLGRSMEQVLDRNSTDHLGFYRKRITNRYIQSLSRA